MCFRPSSAAKAIICPQCGAYNPAKLTNCSKCKAPLVDNSKDKNNNNK